MKQLLILLFVAVTFVTASAQFPELTSGDSLLITFDDGLTDVMGSDWESEGFEPGNPVDAKRFDSSTSKAFMDGASGGTTVNYGGTSTAGNLAGGETILTDPPSAFYCYDVDPTSGEDKGLRIKPDEGAYSGSGPYMDGAGECYWEFRVQYDSTGVLGAIILDVQSEFFMDNSDAQTAPLTVVWEMQVESNGWQEITRMTETLYANGNSVGDSEEWNFRIMVDGVNSPDSTLYIQDNDILYVRARIIGDTNSPSASRSPSVNSYIISNVVTKFVDDAILPLIGFEWNSMSVCYDFEDGAYVYEVDYDFDIEIEINVDHYDILTLEDLNGIYQWCSEDDYTIWEIPANGDGTYFNQNYSGTTHVYSLAHPDSTYLWRAQVRSTDVDDYQESYNWRLYSYRGPNDCTSLRSDDDENKTLKKEELEIIAETNAWRVKMPNYEDNITELFLYDINGRVISTTTVTGDFENVQYPTANGMYFISVVADGIIYSEKVSLSR